MGTFILASIMLVVASYQFAANGAQTADPYFICTGLLMVSGVIQLLIFLKKSRHQRVS